jgi:hypothetical protein
VEQSQHSGALLLASDAFSKLEISGLTLSNVQDQKGEFILFLGGVPRRKTKVIGALNHTLLQEDRRFRALLGSGHLARRYPEKNQPLWLE